MPPFKKGWRRYGYPAMLSIVLLAVGTGWLRTLLTCGIVSFASHLGYGDSATWPKRWLVGFVYGSSLIWLVGWGWTTLWIVWTLSMVWFVGLLWLTRKINAMPHKLVEGLQGGYHAAVSILLATA